MQLWQQNTWYSETVKWDCTVTDAHG